MTLRSLLHQIFASLLVAFSLAVTSFGQTSASLSGEVQDAQGAAIPNATITVGNPATNQRLETTTSAEGTFGFPTLQPGNYTLTIEAAGFKQLVKTGIVLNATDRQSAGALILEPGEVTTTVEVTADAAQLVIRTESGEQGETITGRQVRDLAVNGRNNLDLVKLIPGVNSRVSGQVAGPNGLDQFNINGTRGNQHNLTIDGSTNVDTGSNGTQHVTINLDTIAEYKVLTSNYQAEYGRSAGGDIKIVTRGGDNQFRGTAYYFRRHDSLNANSFFNNADGQPRALYRYNYTGYNVSGPVVLPRFGEGGDPFYVGKDKLFFFFNQEFQRQLVPRNDPLRVRVPTAAEVAGDFSNTRDGNDNRIIIRDPVNGQPFPGNIIPANRITADGRAILGLFNRYENSSGSLPLYNNFSQVSSTYPRRQDNIRIDYNLTEGTRIFGRFTQDNDEQVLPYGVGWDSGQNFPLTPTIFRQGPARNASLNITSALSPTLTNEFVFGPSQNRLSQDAVDPNAGTLAGIGLNFATPFPYSPDQFINIEFGGIPNQDFAVINNYGLFPYRNSNTTFDFIDNVGKVLGTHTLKAGIFVQRSRKDQSAGNSARVVFGNDPINPNNAGHPYANALLGNFNTYSQPVGGIYQGQYRSTNVEWFVQDNWKTGRRLTLDYGVRFVYFQPQYDRRLQSSFFNPALYNPASAVRLYRRGAGATSTQDYAFDPANPSVQQPSFLIGRIVPGSGDPFNGLGLVSNGYPRGGIESGGINIGPAVGFAYDVFGDARTVLRGGYRIGYDRVSGNNLIFPATSNPPANVNPTFNFGNLATVGAATGEIALGTSGVVGADPDISLPSVQSFSLQVQQEVGFSTVVSVAYVGTLSRHLTQLRNLNFIPYGATFLAENQNPAARDDSGALVFPGGVIPAIEPGLPDVYRQAGFNFSGRYALPAEFLRRYPGYNDIAFRENVGSSNYHSGQLSIQRRFNQGLTFGVAYTFSKVLGTANGDGDYTNPIDARRYDYRRLDFDQTHIFVANYVYNLPRLSTRVGALDNRLGRAVFDNWEISGITQIASGRPGEIGVSIPDINANQRVTGSYTEGPRLLLTGDPQPNRGDRTREQYFDYTVFRLPDVGTVGLGPRAYLERPGNNVTDLSLFKNFPFGGEGGRYLQLRGEFFNVFNHAQFDDFNTGLTFNVGPNFANYAANQQASPASVRNVRGGLDSPASGRLGNALGEVTGNPTYVSNRRIIQLAVKLYF